MFNIRQMIEEAQAAQEVFAKVQSGETRAGDAHLGQISRALREQSAVGHFNIAVGNVAGALADIPGAVLDGVATALHATVGKIEGPVNGAGDWVARKMGASRPKG